MAAVSGALGSDDVVRRAQAGDVAAFESLYRDHAGAVYALCRRMARDERAARELVQDVFVRAWERLPTFRGESALGTWLHRLALNVVFEQARIARRDAMRLLDIDDDYPVAHAHDVQADARMDLDTALERLPEGARTVFVLHDMHGYSHDEIARMMGIAASTARVQLWRARRALMRVLDR